MFFRWRLACSFCGKTAAQVSKLVAGRRAYICDACVAEAQRLMSESGGEQAGGSASSTAHSPAPFWQRLVRPDDRGGESMAVAPT
jgi:ATP-dependent protease Clp ATPase subunit